MRLVVLSLLALLTALPAMAQRNRPWAEKGDVALVVGVSGVNATNLLPALDGVGVRYRVRDRTVVGASVGFDYQDQTVGRTGGYEVDNTSGGLRVAVWNENHIGRRGALVSPFVGIGTQVRARNDTYERTQPCPSGGECPESVERVELDATAVGVGALLGAEVRVARGVTLGAAYTVGAEVSRETRDSTPEPGRDRFTTFRAGTGLTALNLSVYF